MTEPTDKLLDEYLRRESAVSQRYREIEADDVPPQLDVAVIAQARAAVTKRSHGKPAWTKWGAPLALAASAVMAIAIVLEVGIQDEVRMPVPQAGQSARESSAPERSEVLQDMRERVAKQAPLPPPAAPEQTKSVVKPDAMPAEQPRTAVSRESRSPAIVPATAPSGSAERAAVESVLVTGAQIRPIAEEAASPVAVLQSFDEPLIEVPSPDVATSMEAKREAQLSEERQARAATSPALANAMRARAQDAALTAQAAQQVPRLEPEPWLEQIRALRREGKVLEADEQWREFVLAYPQFEVSKTDPARPIRQ